MRSLGEKSKPTQVKVWETSVKCFSLMPRNMYFAYMVSCNPCQSPALGLIISISEMSKGKLQQVKVYSVRVGVQMPKKTSCSSDLVPTSHCKDQLGRSLSGWSY